MRSIKLLCCVLFCLGAEAHENEPIKEATTPCSQTSFQQFDFWLGEWDVLTKDGKLAGINRISKAMGGCVIKEHYTTESGYEGESLNIFNSSTQTWHQSWVDNTGLLLQLDGLWNGFSMTLQGQVKNGQGQIQLHRIQWKPQKNGDVHQIWDVSVDRGQHWKNSFFGVYRRKSSH